MTTLITGAAGNLGSLLAEKLIKEKHRLHLMIHSTPLPLNISSAENVQVCKADLSQPETLLKCCQGVDVIVHFAGVLFKPFPGRFLPITNVEYFKNLVDTAVNCGVKKIILISFPHVEGESTPERPAKGILSGSPKSIHAATRLMEEQYLFEQGACHSFTPVSLRAGMVYGKGILMIEAAKWLAGKNLLGIWRKPTWIHLISIDDFLNSAEAAIRKDDVNGIYHVGDDTKLTLQEFLDTATDYWGYKKPWRLPLWVIYTAAWFTEIFGYIFRKQAPLTRDFIKIGMTSYYGDTARMRTDLVKELVYPSFKEGKKIL